MNEAKLIREIKEIVYYIRKYGIDHVQASASDIMGSETLLAEFYKQVHKGFYFAQEKAVYLLTKLLSEHKRVKKVSAKLGGREICNRLDVLRITSRK